MTEAAKRATILVACGSGIATAVAVSSKIKDMLKKNNMPLDRINVIYTQDREVPFYLSTKEKELACIVHTSRFSYETKIPDVNAVPILTGIGVAAAEKIIIDATKKFLGMA